MSEALLLSLWLVGGPSAGATDGLPALRLLVLSPASETAVVACEALSADEADEGVSESPLLVRRGEEIGSTGLTLIEVLPDRIEVRQELAGGSAAASEGRRGDRRLWIYRSRGGAPSRIQVLDRTVPTAPRQGAPLAIAPATPQDPVSPSETEPEPGPPSDHRSGKPAPPSGEAR